MGMDVFGKASNSETGNYFRASVWGWRPLAEFTRFACEVTDNRDLYTQCEYWHTNDGDGLDAEGATKLAEIIDELLDWRKPFLRMPDDTQIQVNGVSPEKGIDVVEAYIRIRSQGIADLPNELCNLCDGTGIRTDEVGQQMKQPEKVIPEDAPEWGDALDGPHPRAGQTGWCNGCDGRGYKRPLEASYRLDKDLVLQWRDFLRDCGGFEIH